MLTEDGPLRIDVPRDRDATFEPLLMPKHERRFTGFDDKIIAMYARGMTVREVQGFLADQYSVEVTRHCTEIGHTRRWRLMKAYFNSALSRSTPSLFPGCRAPSSRAPARLAAG